MSNRPRRRVIGVQLQLFPKLRRLITRSFPLFDFKMQVRPRISQMVTDYINMTTPQVNEFEMKISS
jgi:hypothetical protein